MRLQATDTWGGGVNKLGTQVSCRKGKCVVLCCVVNRVVYRVLSTGIGEEVAAQQGEKRHECFNRAM